MKSRVCTNCGFVGEPIGQGASSFLVDIFIWLLVGGGAAVTGLLPLLVIPVECECLDMVSMQSAKGKAALNRVHHA